VVRWFDSRKGYGFITPDVGPDVFVHVSALVVTGYRTLSDGARVEFDIGPGQKGPAAQNVRLITERT
jgi:CspA family cold shock protein